MLRERSPPDLPKPTRARAETSELVERLAYPRGTTRNLIEIALDLFTSGSITEQRWNSWRVVDERSRSVVKKKKKKEEKTKKRRQPSYFSGYRINVDASSNALYIARACVRAYMYKRASLPPSPRSLFRSIDLDGVTAVTRFEIPRSFTTRRGVSLTIARRRLISRGSRLRASRNRPRSAIATVTIHARGP